MSFRGRGANFDNRGGRGSFRGGGRGGGGRQGGPPRSQPVDVTVTTNCFAIKRLPQKDYFLYGISTRLFSPVAVSAYAFAVFEPEVSNFARRQELFDRLQTHVAPHVFNPRAMYDGKALVFSSHLLRDTAGDGSGLQFLVGFSNKPPTETVRGVYKLIFKLTASEPISAKQVYSVTSLFGVLLIAGADVMENPQAATALNLLNIIIRQDSNQKYPHNARAFFSKVGKKELKGIELWRGFFQSVRPTKDALLVNIDTTMTAVIKEGSLLDVAMDYMGFRNTRELAINEQSHHYHALETFFKKIRVVLQTTKKTRTIRGLVANAGKFAFSKDGESMTVEQYLNKTYNIRIAYPNIVGVRLTKRDEENQIVLPLEMCQIKSGQFYKQRLQDVDTVEAVKFATLNPSDRLNAIKGSRTGSLPMADSPILHYHTSEFVVESGMQISSDPIEIRGQLLALPKVKFQDMALDPENGSWNVLNRILFKSVPLNIWAIVNFADRAANQIDTVISSIMGCAKNLGMSINPPFTVQSGSGQAVEQSLDRTMRELQKTNPNLGKSGPPPLLVVILPQNAAEVRHRVKHWGDVRAGIITQCIREGKLARANNQYFNNIALKLNARLKGSNFIVDSPAMKELTSNGRFIIMGADVAHPGPGVQKPSMTSLVWSSDQHATQYSAITEIQSPRLEIIQNLKQMVYDAIFGFGKLNHSPSQIIFFRDGVSEGEFKKVVEHELQDIKIAIDELWANLNLKDLKPKLTFIVVGKRHHIAFFPAKNSSADDGKGNCVAGFASNVEDLSHPSTTDFYLQSHGAIQGTSRSAHYTIIHDDIYNFNVSKIQELSFALCHVYQKATRSVSIPAPIYYADLACARSAFHYHPGSTDGSSISSGYQNFNLDEWKGKFNKINQGIVKSMYFL
ncbi:Piwi domain-containing protein [Rhodocollybia butyracea]|uniref:Piwi domain-containing protein n=1 Tax=Rhodocollybia butyracea TaxID=206335 RepID=A0A9P5PV19_9AGAR|nr:Piwi domain-containing protein [Rhodocollybia butyracea]